MSYSPTLGRFTEQDPERYTDSLNLYQAYRSNPLAFVDPMGTDSQATTRPATQPHDPKTCPTCTSSDPKKDKEEALVVDDEADNSTNCIGWAMNDRSASFMASLGMGMKKYDQVLNATDAAAQIRAHLDANLAAKGGKRLDNENDECPCGTHKIGVYYRNLYGGKDVHMNTQHSDGSWSGKPSYYKPVISQTPTQAMNTTNGWGSSVELVGFYCVKGPPRCKQ